MKKSIGILNIFVCFALLYAGEAIYTVAGGGLFKSTDYGERWTPIGQEIPVVSCITGTIVEGPPSYYVLYAGAGLNGIYKSTDLGYSWIPINRYQLIADYQFPFQI